MLEPLYHTWWGGFFIVSVLVGAWTLAPLYMGLLVAGMWRHSYGLSAVCLSCIFVEKLLHRQIISGSSLLALLVLGPKDRSEPGFLRYWLCFAQLVAAVATCYFTGRLRPRPGFVKWTQDLDFRKYHYRGCELRGALDDVRKEGSMFGFHPHGILCAGFSWNGAWNKQFRDAAGLETRYMIDKGLHEDNLFFKAVCDLHGTVETLDKKRLTKFLETKTNVAFVPGGFEDATLAEFGVNRTAILKRTGFIKYALQHGTRVHPVYTFGECETHYTVKSFLNFRLWLNKFGVPGVVMFGFPFFPILPRPQAKLLTYVGKGIDFPKIPEPSREDVAKWHKVYIDALVKVFDDNKKEAGLPETAKLEIW